MSAAATNSPATPGSSHSPLPNPSITTNQSLPWLPSNPSPPRSTSTSSISAVPCLSSSPRHQSPSRHLAVLRPRNPRARTRGARARSQDSWRPSRVRLFSSSAPFFPLSMRADPIAPPHGLPSPPETKQRRPACITPLPMPGSAAARTWAASPSTVDRGPCTPSLDPGGIEERDEPSTAACQL